MMVRVNRFICCIRSVLYTKTHLAWNNKNILFDIVGAHKKKEYTRKHIIQMFSANKYKSQPLLYVYDSYEQNGFFAWTIW